MHEVYAACPPDGPLVEMLQACEVTVKTLEMSKRPFAFGRTIHSIRRLIRQHDINLVHANSIDATQYAALPSRLTKTPLIGHVRNIAPFRPHGRWLIQQAHKLIAVSEATKHSLLIQKISPAKVRVIYNGVDTTHFRPDIVNRQTGRKMFQLPVESPIIGSVGRLHPIKGFDDFLTAAQLILQQLPDAHFVIAGSDPEPDQQYAQHLYHLASQLGVKGRIHFLGEVSQIEYLLPALDIFVLPSHQEPFARAILEAMSSGCAIVATAVGGTPEAIEDGMTGLLTPPHQPTLLAAAILKLSQDHNLAIKLRRNARDHVVNRFSITTNIQQTIALYNETYKPQSAAET